VQETHLISLWHVQLRAGEIVGRYDIFGFIDDIKNTDIDPNHILVSYDVSALFTNAPLKETIDILVDKVFEGDWFNNTYSMQLQKHQLTDLLEIATTNQLFQFNGELNEQTHVVAMGSSLGHYWPTFSCAI